MGWFVRTAPASLLPSILDTHTRDSQMPLVVRHGINGNEELTIQVAAGVTVGWDIMQQLALRLALDSPFQIIIYPEQHSGNPLSSASH